MLQDQLLKLYTAEKSNQLTKQACTTYHDFLSSSCFGISLLFAQQRFPMRRANFQSFSKTVFGQECVLVIANFYVSANAATSKDNPTSLKGQVSGGKESSIKKMDDGSAEISSLIFLKMGFDTYKFGASCFSACNFNWTKGVYRAVSNSTHQTLGFLLSLFVFVIELIFILAIGLVGIFIILFSFVLMVVGIIVVPIVFTWNLFFGYCLRSH